MLTLDLRETYTIPDETDGEGKRKLTRHRWHEGVGQLIACDGQRVLIDVQDEGALARFQPDVLIEREPKTSRIYVPLASVLNSDDIRVRRDAEPVVSIESFGVAGGEQRVTSAAPASAAPAPVAVADDDDADDDVAPYDEWPKAELVEECEARGLAKSGSKATLIERLEADDAEADE